MKWNVSRGAPINHQDASVKFNEPKNIDISTHSFYIYFAKNYINFILYYILHVCKAEALGSILKIGLMLIVAIIKTEQRILWNLRTKTFTKIF